MIQTSISDSFSAKVRIELRIAGRCLPVAQAGGGRLIFDEPIALPAGVGELVVYVDESPQRWRVALGKSQGRTRFVSAEIEEIVRS
jgi:hypothetical protein